jgi:hypothetical protein
MLGWRMEEEAKLEFAITVNWRREDGPYRDDAIGDPWTAALAARSLGRRCQSAALLDELLPETGGQRAFAVVCRGII